MSDVRQWLSANGLAQLAETFEREQIDLDALKVLTESNLKDLGLPMGLRAKLLAAIQSLKDSNQLPPPRLPSGVIGVLLVHGIGSSRQGDTVSQWGRAILRGLIRQGAEIEVERSSLRDANTSALADVRVEPQDGAPFRLLIAESWWAEEFSPPSFMSILWWSFRSLPWTIVSHFDERFRRTGNEFQGARGWHRIVTPVNVVIELIWLFVGLLLAPIVLVVLVLLAILRIVPYEPLQNGIRIVFQTIAVTIGDSYVFTENPIVQRAITDRVERDLKALKQLATGLVVIAHSQGAAVAHRVLREHYHEDIAWLVTYGSGLRKLRELLRLQPLGRAERRQQFKRAQQLAWMSTLAAVSAAFVMAAYGLWPTTSGAEFVEMALALPFAIAGIGLAVRTVLDRIFPDKLPAPAADDLEKFDQGMVGKNRRSKRLNYGGLAIIVAVASAMWATGAGGSNAVTFSIAVLLGLSFTWLMSWRHAAGRLTHAAEHEAKERLVWNELELARVARWDDFYARKDPVSNGPLLESFRPKLASRVFASHEIANWESPVLDHTTYWSNAPQFVDPIARSLLRVGRGEKVVTEDMRRPGPLSNLVYRLLSLLILVVTPLYLIWDPDVSPASLLPLWPAYEGEGPGAVLSADASLGSKLTALWHWARHGIVLAIVLIAAQTALDCFYSRLLQRAA
jgi:hypothetical protein